MAYSESLEFHIFKSVRAVVNKYLVFTDDEELDKDLDDLIDDNPVEEDPEDDGDSGSGNDGEQTGGEKRQHSDYGEDLEDEDYDLIEENLGIRVKRKVGRLVRSSRLDVVSSIENVAW